MNGAWIAHPSDAAAAFTARLCWYTTSHGSSLMMPATGRGSPASTSPSATAT